VIDIIPGRQLAVIKSRKRFPSISMPSFLFVRAAAFTDLIPNKYDPLLGDPIGRCSCRATDSSEETATKFLVAFNRLPMLLRAEENLSHRSLMARLDYYPRNGSLRR